MEVVSQDAAGPAYLINEQTRFQLPAPIPAPVFLFFLLAVQNAGRGLRNSRWETKWACLASCYSPVCYFKRLERRLEHRDLGRPAAPVSAVRANAPCLISERGVPLRNGSASVGMERERRTRSRADSQNFTAREQRAKVQLAGKARSGNLFLNRGERVGRASPRQRLRPDVLRRTIKNLQIERSPRIWNKIVDCQLEIFISILDLLKRHLFVSGVWELSQPLPNPDDHTDGTMFYFWGKWSNWKLILGRNAIWSLADIFFSVVHWMSTERNLTLAIVSSAHTHLLLKQNCKLQKKKKEKALSLWHS